METGVSVWQIIFYSWNRKIVVALGWVYVIGLWLCVVSTIAIGLGLDWVSEWKGEGKPELHEVGVV